MRRYKYSYAQTPVFAGLLLVLSLGLLSCSGGGEGIAMRELVPEQVSGWSIQDSADSYDTLSIYDYINGAAEVYRSYDYRALSVFRYIKPDAPEITVELFDMGSDENAYGVFSHARESESTGIGQAYEYQGGVLCFWQAQYFVCVMAESQSEEIDQAIHELARMIDSRIAPSGNAPDLVGYLPKEGLDEGSVRFFHIHPSLNYHYYVASGNILNLGKDTRAVLGRYEPDETYVLCIEYPSAATANEARESFVAGYIPEEDESGATEIETGRWVAVRAEGAYVVVVFDAVDRDAAMVMIESVLADISESK